MADLKKRIWEKALHLLSLRAHSRHELRQKLRQRFPEESSPIDETLDEMERVQILNDRQFTEAFIRSLIEKPIGRIKIMVETRRRGLDQDLVNNMLLNFGWDEEASARRALAEKEARTTERDPRKRKMKLISFLRSRGFKEATIYRVLK